MTFASTLTLADRRRWMRILAGGALLAVVLSSACSGPDAVAPGTVAFGRKDSVFTDEQLLAASYSDYRFPPGFYSERASDLAFYYVNTGSVADSRQRPAPPWTELSTDDPAQAREWVDETIASGNAIAPKASETPLVTERYFEFEPQQVAGLSQVRMRVSRASYLEGCVAYGPHFSGAMGRFAKRPVDPENVHTLAEYLWYRQFLQVPSEKVLSSFARPEGRWVSNTMYVVHRVGGGDPGLTDRISLGRLVIRVSRTTGEVVCEAQVLREIDGHVR